MHSFHIKILSRILLWVLMALMWTVNTQANESRVLVFSHTNGPTGARHEASLLFAKKVDEYTNGSLEVRVFHSGQIANDPKAVELIKLGGIDFTVTSTGSYAPHLKTLNLLFLPYLVDDYEQGWKLYDESPWVAQQFEELREQGIHVLSVWEAGFRQFTTVEPLLPPEEANSEKMRVFPNESLRWMVESFNFNPGILPATEVYLAIQQGTVIGQENPIDTIFSLRFYEVAPHVTLTSHIYGPIPFSIAESTWKSLTDAEKEAVQRAATEAGAFCRQLVLQEEPRQLSEMRQEGATIYRPELDSYKTAAQSVYARARDLYGEHVDVLLADAESVRKGQPFQSLSPTLLPYGKNRPIPLSMIVFFVVFSVLVGGGIWISSRLEESLLGNNDLDEPFYLRWIGNVTDWSIIWSGATIVVLMFGNVVSRFLLKFDVAWTSELSVFLMVWAVFLGGVAATRRRTQMRVGEFLGLIPENPRKTVAALTHLAPIVLLVMLIIEGIGLVRINIGQNLVALGWPVGWQYAALPVGSALALIYSVRDLIETIIGKYDPGKIGDGADV